MFNKLKERMQKLEFAVADPRISLDNLWKDKVNRLELKGQGNKFTSLEKWMDTLRKQREVDNEQVMMATDLCHALMDHHYKPGRLEMREVDE